MNRRRASSLVELMMCMTAGSSLMLVAIGLVHQTLTVSRQASQQTDHDRSLARLSTLFRYDIHRATEASADSEDVLRLSWPDQTEVTYRFADQRITRRHELTSGEVENESFTFDTAYSVSFQTLSDPNRAELLIRRGTPLRNVPPRLELHVVATLNKWSLAEHAGEEDGP